MKIAKRVLWLSAITVGLWNVSTQARPQQTLEFEPDTIGVLNEINTLSVEEVSVTPAVPGDLLRERFAKLEREVPLVYHSASHQFVEYFIYKKPDFTRRMMEDSALYLPIFEQYLKKYNLPTELKYLSMIESGLNPRIISYASAGGLWQFMPATGREFGLYQDKYIDERFDPVKSTEAACKYLRQLYRIFGDWEMALASYNTGPGNVRRAMRRSGGKSFWTIYNALPQQTRSYVPQYVAMTYMMHYGNDHGIVAVNPKFPVATDTVHINGYVDLARFAQHTGISLEEIQNLNPHIVSTELPGHTRHFVLKVPSEKFSYLYTNRLAIMDSCRQKLPSGVMLASAHGAGVPTSLASYEEEYDESPTTTRVTYQKRKLTHVVKRGESLNSIANRYDVEISEVKKWNRLRKSTIMKGQRLVVYREVAVRTPVRTAVVASAKPAPAATEEVEEAVASNEEASDEAEEETVAKTAVTPQKRKQAKIYVVKSGDNLISIARRNGVEVSDVKEWNNLRSSSIQRGQKLIVSQEVFEKAPVQASAVASAKTTTTKEKEVLASHEEVEEEEEEVAQPVKAAVATTQKRKQTHVVKSGDNLISIAKRYGVEVDDVKEWNHLRNSSIRKGQKLTVYRPGNESAPGGTLAASVREKEPAQPKAQKSLKLRYHTVQNGDTLWNISQQYGLSIDRLKKVNNIKGSSLKPGQKLIVSS